MDLHELASTHAPTELSKHWYYRSKAKAVAHVLRNAESQSLLDVGAGSGFFAAELLRTMPSLQRGVCVDPGYPVDDSASIVNHRELRFVRTIETSDADVVLMMDVLEHVDDDSGLVRQYLGKCPAADFVITVPAFQQLWSTHDDFLQHRRRYSLPQLRSTLERAGLRIDQLFYFYAAVLPLAAVARLTKRMLSLARHHLGLTVDSPSSDLRRQPAVFNWMLGKLCEAEINMMSANQIAGLSVIARARLR
jgi:hypothetical protein